MARTIRAQLKNRHERLHYCKHAFKHPMQALVLVTPVILALLTLSMILPLVVMLVAEVIVIAVVPRCAWFRTAVDEQVDRLARAEAAEVRASLLARISDEHRRELENLERLAAQIRERSGQTEERRSAGEDWLGLDRLLGTYVRLAMACRTSVESFRAVDRATLDDHVLTLEAMRIASTDSTRTWIDRRLAIAHRRVAAADRAHDERERLAHGLATIGELVRWMYEECVATRAELVHAELEDALTTWEQNGTTLHELSTLCDGLETVDVDALALGRDSNPPAGPSAITVVEPDVAHRPPGERRWRDGAPVAGSMAGPNRTTVVPLNGCGFVRV